eukprot:3037434-Pyramimonas_sp.AAC.1
MFMTPVRNPPASVLAFAASTACHSGTSDPSFFMKPNLLWASAKPSLAMATCWEFESVGSFSGSMGIARSLVMFIMAI